MFSTHPTTFAVAWSRPRATTDTGPTRRSRESLDPDDFAQGFATWSGTSFAAPGVAGRYLRHLIESRDDASPAEVLADPHAALKAALNELPKRH